MTAAKRNLLKAARRQRLANDPALTILWPDENTPVASTNEIPDDRLRLMFVCAHPSIESSVRTALMLQVVLGLEAHRIADAFLVSAEAMTKRLVRAKAKIRTAGIRFDEPTSIELPGRLDAVLEAIYGAYVCGCGQALDDAVDVLAQEAVYLAELVCHQAADEPHRAEAQGLFALLLYCEARRPARLDAEGDFVPLDRHDVAEWNEALISRANALLAAAADRRMPGPFQLEAAIQSAHCDRLRFGSASWRDIVTLYQRLLAISPNVGARIGHAMAAAKASTDPQIGLALLEAIGPEQMVHHQPWWAARAQLLNDAGRFAEARSAYTRAHSLTKDPVLQRYLMKRIEMTALLS